MQNLKSFMVALLIALAPAISLAQPERLTHDPKRPVDLISRDLGIQPAQFVECFKNVHPAPEGTRPTREQVQANKAVLLPCLQKAKPGITNDQLDEAMDRYRPGGREAQEPAR